MPKKQVHIIFKGSVQGVGFRFTAERIAIRLGIVGWIKNLDNGDVEITAEAEKEALDEFLENIRNRFSRYISDEEVDFKEAAGKFNVFQIKL